MEACRLRPPIAESNIAGRLDSAKRHGLDLWLGDVEAHNRSIMQAIERKDEGRPHVVPPDEMPSRELESELEPPKPVTHPA